MSNTVQNGISFVSKAWFEIFEEHLFSLFQYGFVNYALELLVLKTFGEEKWEQIKYVTLLPVNINFSNYKMFHIFTQLLKRFVEYWCIHFWHKHLFIQTEIG